MEIETAPTLAGQRVPIRVPRMRSVAGSEIPLRSYEAWRGDGEVNDLLLTRVLYGISCRNYEAAAETIPGAIGLSGSTVSRGFIQASPAKLREFQERDLSSEDVVAVVLDGKTFADAVMVIAVGITISGEKRFLGFVETDTENARVLTPFLRSLVERGLDLAQGVLVILDGGKGLRSSSGGRCMKSDHRLRHHDRSHAPLNSSISPLRALNAEGNPTATPRGTVVNVGVPSQAIIAALHDALTPDQQANHLSRLRAYAYLVDTRGWLTSLTTLSDLQRITERYEPSGRRWAARGG